MKASGRRLVEGNGRGRSDVQTRSPAVVNVHSRVTDDAQPTEPCHVGEALIRNLRHPVYGPFGSPHRPQSSARAP